MIDPYEVLGVEPTADKEQIKKAYRVKAKRYHPDRGGDKKDMEILSLCYRTLLDDGKRAHIDAGGEMDAPDTPPQDSKAYTYLTKKAGELISTILEQGGSMLTVDMVRLFSTAIQTDIHTVPGKIKKIQRGRKELEACKKKFKQKPGTNEDDLLLVWLTREVQNFDKKIAELHESLEVMRQAKAVVDSYTFEVDVPDFLSMLSGGYSKSINFRHGKEYVDGFLTDEESEGET